MKNSFYFVFGLTIAALLMLPYFSNSAENKPKSAASSKSRLTLKVGSLNQSLNPSVSGSKGNFNINSPAKVKDRMPKIKVKSSSFVPSNSTSID